MTSVPFSIQNSDLQTGPSDQWHHPEKWSSLVARKWRRRPWMLRVTARTGIPQGNTRDMSPPGTTVVTRQMTPRKWKRKWGRRHCLSNLLQTFPMSPRVRARVPSRVASEVDGSIKWPSCSAECSVANGTRSNCWLLRNWASMFFPFHHLNVTI